MISLSLSKGKRKLDEYKDFTGELQKIPWNLM